MNNDRVLARRGARELTKDETPKVYGGTHVMTVDVDTTIQTGGGNDSRGDTDIDPGA